MVHLDQADSDLARMLPIAEQEVSGSGFDADLLIRRETFFNALIVFYRYGFIDYFVCQKSGILI
jgi:hypothetical protein